MLDRDFYTWLKDLSEDGNFLNTISLADRLIEEKYNMELALRFLILLTINPNEVKSLNDFGEFVTDKMILMVQNQGYDRSIYQTIFKETFRILNETFSEQAFKKFNIEKGRFEGKFLLAAYEAIAIGVGKNSVAWAESPMDEARQENLINKVKGLWQNPQFQAKYGSGVNVTSRVPIIVPLGTEVLVP
jgi:hypothetical protein